MNAYSALNEWIRVAIRTPSPATRLMQLVRVGLEAIYLSGWQVAADAYVAGAMHPDQSLYPAHRNVPLAPNPRSVSRRAARA